MVSQRKITKEQAQTLLEFLLRSEPRDADYDVAVENLTELIEQATSIGQLAKGVAEFYGKDKMDVLKDIRRVLGL